jgi:hypothetical protein
MKKFVLISLICISTVVGSEIMMNHFSSGELSPQIDGRFDIEDYYSGSQNVENMIVLAQGAVKKRPGLYYIADADGTVNSYPTLQIADTTFQTRASDPNLTHTTTISDINDLNDIRDDLNGNYYLTADIDASDTATWNDGDGWEPIEAFSGTLDGCSYTITGLTINRPSEDYVGLFSKLYFQSTQEEGVDYYNEGWNYYNYNASTSSWFAQTFTASESYDISTVTLRLWRSGTPDTVTVSIRETSGNKPTGEDLCYGTRNGNEFIDQSIEYGTWYDFELNSPYSLTESTVYAIVIRATDTRFYWAKDTSGTYSGGRMCYSTNSGSSWGAISSQDFMFITYKSDYGGTPTPVDVQIANLTLSDCNVIGNDYVGTLSGLAASSDANTTKIYNCHSSGTVTGAGAVGGFIGEATGDSELTVDINDCVCSASVEASGEYCGGFIGYSQGYLEINNCRASGDISGSDNTGGFLGGIDHDSEDDEILIEDCSATGDVSGGNYVGGFIGYYNTTPNTSRCSARGDVTGSGDIVGGFIGYANLVLETTVKDCYAWGEVTASDYAGGFIGENAGEDINNCYSIGECTGSTTGGFSSVDDDSNNVTNSFWDTDASGESESASGEGQTTSWMKVQLNYENAGWDFDTVWEMGTSGFVVVRLITFEHSIEQSYILGLGHEAIAFYKEN